MAVARPATLLTRLSTTGVAGLPDLDLALGPLTALIGPRGSGKSQLLGAVAWLVTKRPPIVPAANSDATRVSGEVRTAGSLRGLVRRPAARLVFDPGDGTGATLPTCSFLRATDRLGRSTAPLTGRVGSRLAQMANRSTSDAAAAEALVAVIEACCEECLEGEILLIEEPELLLTPQAQRYLYRLLRRFADGGNQVLYSTRSPAFVDAAHHDEIVRLDLRHRRRSLRRTSPQVLTDAERVRLAAEFDHERSEMFFGRAVLLVEGQTERLALPAIFHALGHDPDALGIAITEVGGKANLTLAARLLRQLHIPFMIVFDSDRGAPGEQLNDGIRAVAAGAPVVALDPDFEAAAGIASHDDKVLHAWQRFAAADRSAVPGALTEVVERAVTLLS